MDAVMKGLFKKMLSVSKLIFLRRANVITNWIKSSQQLIPGSTEIDFCENPDHFGQSKILYLQ